MALHGAWSAQHQRARIAVPTGAEHDRIDAFRLCSSEIPKITACMIKQRANLRSGCRAVMGRDMAKKSSNVAEDWSASP
jgi:hypothetical protein